MIAPAAVNIAGDVFSGVGGGEIYAALRSVTSMTLFFTAIFAAMYIGTDYSDRAVRNKLIIGISRVKIYFANLITVLVGMTLIFLANWLTAAVWRVVNGGYLKLSVGVLAQYMVFCFIAGMAMMAVCTLLATLVTSRSLGTALTIVLTIGMFIGSHGLLSLSYSSSGASKIVRDAAKVIYNILPTNQLSEFWWWISSRDNYLEFNIFEPLLTPLFYSLGVTVIFTFIGVLAFRKKDLK